MKRSTVVVRAGGGKTIGPRCAPPGRPHCRLRARVLLVVLAVLCRPAFAAAQVPPNDDWRTFETEHFRVTFPAPIEALARRAGASAERAWQGLSAGLTEAPGGRIDLVVTDHVDHSNGYAGVAPRRRIVVYARPPIDGFGLTYYDDWMDLVITHELTHVFQFEVTGPLGRALRSVFGRVQITWPFFPNQGTPGWVTEGLAVYYETDLTGAGRGEGTYHAMILRTAALEGALEGIDVASGSSPEWPAGDRPYVYGSQFYEWLLTHHDRNDLGELVDAIARQKIPYRLNAAARNALGSSFSDEWRVWQAELETQAMALRATLAARAPLTEPEPVVTNSYYVLAPAISPDGSRLAFGRADGHTDPQIRVTAPDGSASRQLARTNDASFFTWMPDGSIVVAQLEYDDPYHIWSDLYHVSASGAVKRITHGSRLDQPGAEPSGRTALAIQSVDGSSQLVRVDLTSGGVSAVVPADPDVHWAFPAASPDGRWIAASRWRRGRSFDVVLLDAATGRIAYQVTDDRALDLSPSWSPDGRWLLWSSDRSGIPNVMAVPIDATGRPGAARQVTNVATGVAYPSVDPSMRWIYLAGYHADGWDVERIPFDPARWTDPFPTAPIYTERAPEPLPPPAQAPARTYQAARTLLPQYWEPFVGGPLDVVLPGGGSVELLGPTFGFYTSAQDVVGRNALSLDARVSTTDAKLQGAFAYQYLGLGVPTLSLRLDQSWDGSGPIVVNSIEGVPDTLFQRERERKAAAGATVILRRTRVLTAISGAAGLVQQDAELLDRDLRRSSFVLPRPRSRLGDVTASVSVSSARAHSFSISQEEGAAVIVQGRVRRELSLADSLRSVAGADGSLRELIGRTRLFQPLRFLGLTGHVIALRGSVGAANGSGADRFHFDVGGAAGAAESLTGLGLFGGASSLFPVRGYRSGERAGRMAWSAAAEYRFPIARVNRGVGLIPIHLEQVSGDLFADAGNAWGPELGEADPRFHNPRRATLASVGAELSFDMTVFFSAYLPLRLGAALPLVEANGQERALLFYLRFGPSF